MNLREISYIILLFLLFFSAVPVPIADAGSYSKNSLQVISNESGIRIRLPDIEVYFNATNGGEITEYYDLTIDPLRLNNLVNLRWSPWFDLLPLFTSLFYKSPYSNLVYSTGGDPNAMLWLIANTSEYVILQSSSRLMDGAGRIAKDLYGNSIYINSTWIIRRNNLISVERTFSVRNYVSIHSGWRWYPFYLTRDAGFGGNGTFFMFNSTYAYDKVVNTATYRDVFSSFSILPSDTRHVCGVAFPFSNTDFGGDGTHNIIIAYKYDEMLNVAEWRSDNYYNELADIIEGGAVYEFISPFNIFTHTYHALINFTRQPISVASVQNYADYYANDPSVALLMNCSVSTNKNEYSPGEQFVFYGSGISYYDLTRLAARITVKDSSNRLVYQRNYGPGNIKKGQSFNITLLEGIVQPAPNNYTILLQILSPSGVTIASSSKTITVTAT